MMFSFSIFINHALKSKHMLHHLSAFWLRSGVSVLTSFNICYVPLPKESKLNAFLEQGVGKGSMLCPLHV